MARSTKPTLSDLQRDVLTQLAADGPLELEALAQRWWGSDETAAALALESLCEEGLVHAQHLYPGQLLFQKVDPKSAEGRARGARSFYKATRDGKRAVRR